MNHDTPTAGKPQRRFHGGTAKSTVDTESRTCELSFSSTAPVPRAFGQEVLSHAAGAADLSRLNNSAPLLFNHDMNDILGVVQSARIAAGKGRAIVRFGKDERGEWAMQQAADGVLVNVSFTYCVNDYDELPDGQFIARKWEALEISLVTVPADNSVGIGRSINFTPRKNIMNDDFLETSPRGSRTQRDAETREALRAQAQSASADERARMTEIAALGRRYQLPETLLSAMQRDGTSIEDARARTAEHITRMNRESLHAVGNSFDGSTEIGLSDRETQQFSILRAVNAMVSGDWEKAGFERASSRAVAQKLGKPTRGIFVPAEVLARSPWQQQRAPYSVGTPGAGGSLVETQLLPDSFIEVLRNQSAVLAAGATSLTGLVGNVDIPRQDNQTVAYWVAESGMLAESEAFFDKLSLRPKTIGCLSKISRLALMQTTPALETLVRADMIAVIALGIDLAALSGPGTGNQPTGVANTAGIGAYIGGANGANITLDAIIGMEKVLANANAPLTGRAYILNPATIASLKALKSSTGSYLWTTAPTGQRSATPGTINGYPLFQTNQARSTLTKGTSVGNCSEVFFGAWPDVVVSEWGVLEIVPNPYGTNDFQSGDVSIRAMQTLDIGVRHGASFVAMSDALTP